MTDGGTWDPPQTAPVEPARPARSRGPLIAAAVGVIALVAAGVFAITRVTGDDSAGGAGSPEQAGLGLLAALENEDVLGVIDLLLPGERETFRQPMTDLVDDLRRMDILSDDADLAAVSGVDIQFEDESVDVAATNVEDIVNLTLNASGTGSINGESLPIGDLLLDNVGASPGELTAEAAEAAAFTLPITAVQEDGRWYLSGFYTIAERARQSMPGTPPIPTEGIVAVGGTSPEDAMDNLLDGLEALDLQGIIGSLNPEEFAALQRYAPLFLGDAQSALDEARGALTIDDPQYTVSGSGDSRSVTFTYLRFTIDVEDDPGTVTLEDGCWTVEARGDVLNTCELAGEMPQLDEVFEDPQPVEDLLASFEETFAGYENPGFIVKQVDGEWFVSPLATILEQVLAVTGTLDRAEIEDLQARVQEALEQFEGDLTFTPDELLPPEVAPIEPEQGSAPATTAVPGRWAPVGPEEDCYRESDPLVAADCFRELVDSAVIEPAAVPFYLRFPECGLAAVGWSGDYSTLPDDDFVAIVTETAPCFQEKMASGEATEFDLPPEVVRPECLEGRNWYTATEDEAYIEAFNACVYG